MSRPVTPLVVVQMVEAFVDEEFRRAKQYSNKSVLDDSGVYDLHGLAARVFAAGFEEGVSAEAARARGRRNRQEASND